MPKPTFKPINVLGVSDLTKDQMVEYYTRKIIENIKLDIKEQISKNPNITIDEIERSHLTKFSTYLFVVPVDAVAYSNISHALNAVTGLSQERMSVDNQDEINIEYFTIKYDSYAKSYVLTIAAQVEKDVFENLRLKYLVDYTDQLQISTIKKDSYTNTLYFNQVNNYQQLREVMKLLFKIIYPEENVNDLLSVIPKTEGEFLKLYNSIYHDLEKVLTYKFKNNINQVIQNIFGELQKERQDKLESMVDVDELAAKMKKTRARDNEEVAKEGQSSESKKAKKDSSRMFAQKEESNTTETSSIKKHKRNYSE